MKDFQELSLINRLGQSVDLNVKYESISGRDCVFIVAPVVKASSLIAKNAEQFASQLVEHFTLRPEAFDLIELRSRDGSPLELLHWSFDWYESVAVKARSQSVTAERRVNRLLSALAA